MVAVGTLLATVGFIAMAYSAWRAVSFRENLKLSHEAFEGLPFEILLELVIGTVLACVGGMGMAGDLRPITFLASEQSLRVNTHRTGFMTFNHRGRAFREEATD
mmetsp:Transcript_31531/g.56431  ORF Transcript_31531/g.56431 Transcript_31531/m.56431 type:complete len:104 (-) Transcript_31531:111-422(-)